MLKRPQAGPRPEVHPICGEHLVDGVRPLVQQLPLERCGGGVVADLRLQEQGAEAGKGIRPVETRGDGYNSRFNYVGDVQPWESHGQDDRPPSISIDTALQC